MECLSKCRLSIHTGNACVLVWRETGYAGHDPSLLTETLEAFVRDVYEKFHLGWLWFCSALIYAFVIGLVWFMGEGFILDIKNHPFSGMTKILANIL